MENEAKALARRLLEVAALRLEVLDSMEKLHQVNERLAELDRESAEILRSVEPQVVQELWANARSLAEQEVRRARV